MYLSDKQKDGDKRWSIALEIYFERIEDCWIIDPDSIDLID